MRPWYLGNTTVRSPFRLRDGLLALANSPLGGHIKGRENEIKFAWVLHNSGVATITRADADVSDLGRKWRAALSQLGFIVPDIKPKAGISQAELGEPFTITQNGRRLISSDSVAGMQECFLRSLAAYYIPSVLERGYSFSKFSPLRHTLSIMLELERRTGESRLNFLEMGLHVQLTSSDNPLEEIVDSILEFRASREESSNKRRFDQQALDAAAVQHNYVAGTFKDYADTNFRYLKATGLVHTKGRGITLVPEKEVFIKKLVEDTSIPDSDHSFLITLCKGATLPTDNKDAALVVLDDLLLRLKRRGMPYDMTGKSVQTPADIAVIRHDIENILAAMQEEEYALRQAKEWGEIAEYMELIIHPRRRASANDDNTISIPQTEAPAYFEWVLWRAFLAIDSLKNKPYEARRFKIDQDFLPVGTAPGNGPDIIFEFEDFVVAVEVTLTENSRQEAVEGEPVRRHVADLISQYSGKSVYGLFIANRIDLNTTETFRSGAWYAKDSSKMSLNIVPLTLAQFKIFFEALFRSGNINVLLLRDLLEVCSSSRPSLEAPAWQTIINETVQEKAAFWLTRGTSKN